jgi:hypothetical protein
MSAMPGVSMKNVLQLIACYLVLASGLALASGVALSLASTTLPAASGDYPQAASAPLALPVKHWIATAS